ncbi:MAG: hypothetical protein V1790_01870 [Planctomycetota bacterium]
MSTISESAVRTILKYDLRPTVEDNTEVPTFFLDKLLASAEGIQRTGGKNYYTYITAKAAKALGVGQRGAGKTLPPGSTATWYEHRIDLCRLYSTAEYDGPVKNIRSAEELVDPLTDAVADAKFGIKWQAQALFSGAGKSAIALIASATDNGSTVTYVCTRNEAYPGVGRLLPGMVIDSYNGTTGKGTNTQGINTVTIDSVDPSAESFTVTEGSATGAASEYVFFDESSGSQVDAVPMGLVGIVDGPDSNNSSAYDYYEDLQGGDASAYKSWQAQTLTATSARYLTGELLEDAARKIAQNSRDRSVDSSYVLYSAGAVRHRFRKDESRDVDWVNKTRVTAGVKTVDQMVNDSMVSWVVDECCGALCVMLIKPSDLAYKSLPMEVMDEEMFVRLENLDTYRMQLKQYSQIGCIRRDSHAVIRDLLET